MELAPELIACLGDRAMREAARAALLDLGEPVLDHLQRALQNPELPRATRAHVPRTISPFLSQRAADGLLQQLVVETDGMVRYKILRGLGRMVEREPTLSLAPEVLDEIIAGHLRGIFQLLHWRVTLQQAANERPEWRTTGYELLTSLLHHKATLASERLFRVLGLRYREEDVGQIYAGLNSADAATRSSSRELLEHILAADLRTAVIGLVDEIEDAERLGAGSAYCSPEPVELMALVAALRNERSASISCLAVFYAGQIGVVDGAAGGAGEAREDTSLARLRERWLHPFKTRAAVAEPPPDPLLGQEGETEVRA